MKIIILIGESAVGKDTLLYNLSKRSDCDICISHTTRPIRKTETEGKEYYFINNQDFLSMKERDEFVECRQYNTIYNNEPCLWCYGLGRNELYKNDKHKLLIVDYEGFKTIREKLKNEKDIELISIFISAPAKNRIIRAMKRDDSDSSCYEIARRLLDDRSKVSPARMEVDYVLKNETHDDLKRNITFINSIIDK